MKQVLSLIMLFVLSQAAISQVKLNNLQVENQSSPMGIDQMKPRFSWVLNSPQHNVMQTAYELEVSQGKKLVWSSGKVMTDQSTFVVYAGPDLSSCSRYDWKVRVYDNQGQSSEWAGASFETAFYQKSDWKASWITSGIAGDTVNGIVPVFRKAFKLNKSVKSARLYVTSLGVYDLKINGSRVGDDFLTPGWTSYKKHLQYQVYDVSSSIKKGDNAIRVLLGSGWYRTRLTWQDKVNIYGDKTALLLQLEVTYTNGKKEIITSDESWKAAESHIRYSEIYDGEIQDLSMQMADYSMPAYNDASWKNVEKTDHTYETLTSQINEPISIVETLKPKLITSAKGVKILDFGQNLVGWVKLSISGNAGKKLKLTHIEMLDKFGEPYYENLRSAKAQASYMLDGKSHQTEPHFTFYGFRYAIVEGIDQVNPNDFEGIVLSSNMKTIGSFECSDPMLNQLQSNINWSLWGNFLDVPTDCPQRDERLGWTGDAEVFSRTATFNRQANQFFAKWLKDVAADQKPNGSVPFVIPDVLSNTNMDFGIGAAGWSDASIIIPYNTFLSFGDKQVLEVQYPSMQAYLNYMHEASNDDLWNTGFQFADWLSYRVDDSKTNLGQKSAITDNFLVAQCFYAYCCEIMQEVATVLGKKEDAQKYKTLLAKVKSQFQKEFMTASGRLISETQTAYVLALQFDMLPESLRPSAVDRLVKNIESYNYHLTTGFLGTPFLNHVLTRYGKADVAYKLLYQDTYPSWLYPIKYHEATTIWERWDSKRPDSTFQDPGMTSFNHYAYGAIGDWMYRTIGGIDTDKGAGAGYKHILIQPVFDDKLSFAKTSLETNYGLLSTDWKKSGNQVTMQVTIPANTSASVTLPTKDPTSVVLDGKSIGENHVKLGSGKYEFKFSL